MLDRRPRTGIVRAIWGGTLAFWAVGCSAVINPDIDRLGTPIDSGVTDTSTRDSATTDTSRPDTNMSCDPLDPPRCVGESYVQCLAGRIAISDCGPGTFCSDIGGCQPWVCTPGSMNCSADGRALLVCDERGSSSSSIPCANGCNSATSSCNDDIPPQCRDLPSINVGGRVTVDTCDAENTATPIRGGNCPNEESASGRDRTFRIVIEAAGTYRFFVEDVDLADLDVVVYVRSICDDPFTQEGCMDQPCMLVECINDRSALDLALAPGIYYVVVDTYPSGFGGDDACGDIRLSVARADST